MGPSRLETNGDVARREPLAQVLQAAKQVVQPQVRLVDVLGSLDRDPDHAIARPLLDGLDHGAARLRRGRHRRVRGRRRRTGCSRPRTCPRARPASLYVFRSRDQPCSPPHAVFGSRVRLATMARSGTLIRFPSGSSSLVQPHSIAGDVACRSRGRAACGQLLPGTLRSRGEGVRRPHGDRNHQATSQKDTSLSRLGSRHRARGEPGVRLEVRLDPPSGDVDSGQRITLNRRWVAFGVSITSVRSSRIWPPRCSNSRVPLPRRTGARLSWISSSRPTARHC